MLSYQHLYHVGNFADVLKHIVLIKVLTYFKSKQKPLCFIDTHAGSGAYRLHSMEAQKNQEFLNGIGALWQQIRLPSGVAEYVDLIKQFNQDGPLRAYPGSPLIASSVLTASDRLFYYELHPAEVTILRSCFNKDKRIKIFNSDGLRDSLGLLPPIERRGVILIDPSYEIKTEYQDVVTALIALHKRFATGCYVLWYPVVDRLRNRQLERALQNSGIKNIQLFELGILPDDQDFGMTACGMIVVNPPWTLIADMQQILPWLAATLGVGGQGKYRIEQLADE
ncbi:MAG: 23S rRNA (adenine(2030)-N(6))-methyltransferase RlmJ [Gammaproteobacteria bacterium]|nr:23S rRNA (adenine(2030)-N(6))-methyltransferase RlmJ [Gammaproteobacteria bacterium]